MKKTWLVLFVVFGLVIISCDNESEMELDNRPKPEKHYTIIGEWIWLWNCDSYSSYSPETTGISICLNFVRNDSVIVIENSDTVFKAEYYIRKEETDLFGKEVDVLYLNSDKVFATQPPTFFIASPLFDRYIILSLTDTLSLHEYSLDGFCTFKRKIK